MRMVPHRTVEDSCRSDTVPGNIFFSMRILSTARTVLLSYSRAVWQVPLLPARLNHEQDLAPAKLKKSYRGHPDLIADENDTLRAVVTLVSRV